MIDYQGIYHVGVLTPDLDKAMNELGTAHGVEWCTVQDRVMAVRTPDGDHEWAIRFTYSTEGPQHIELLEAEAGSYWDATGRAGLHHVGLWIDDLAAGMDHLTAQGWATEASGIGPSGELMTFAYLRPPSGLLVELVDVRARPRFEQWWAGGDL